ncbi:hypothetical protein [Paraburkholderia atlantica]|uniref:hypothetical protein n=1 Tax=Paraburkholderia atlantica TaxID=2654982 RepID=UPI003D1A6C16
MASNVNSGFHCGQPVIAWVTQDQKAKLDSLVGRHIGASVERLAGQLLGDAIMRATRGQQQVSAPATAPVVEEKLTAGRARPSERKPGKPRKVKVIASTPADRAEWLERQKAEFESSAASRRYTAQKARQG